MTNRALAAFLGYSESIFSLYINGKRPAPKGFGARVESAVELLVQAESAANEARERVLAQSAGSDEDLDVDNPQRGTEKDKDLQEVSDVQN